MRYVRSAGDWSSILRCAEVAELGCVKVVLRAVDFAAADVAAEASKKLVGGRVCLEVIVVAIAVLHRNNFRDGLTRSGESFPPI